MRSERLVALLFTLQSRRSATVAELAEALEVSQRTMHRDLAALQAAGVPLWTESGRYGGVRLMEGWRTRLDGLTAREAVALFTMGASQALAELGLGTAGSAAYAKVTATLPVPMREHAQQIAQRFHLDTPGWFREGDDIGCLPAVATAVWEQRRIAIHYCRRDMTVERVVDPLGLVLKAGVWYLVADVENTTRTYRMSRITTAEPRDEHFERPMDFDLADWWERSSQRFERSRYRFPVRLRLSPAGVRILPDVLDADMAVAALDKAGPAGPDGWTDIEVPLQAPEIAAHQLLALGTDVEILEPVEVRAIFAGLTRVMTERHGPQENNVS